VIRNIIFDWSGTLVDDLPAVWQATNHVFHQAGVPELTLEQFRAEFRLPFAGFYDRFIPHIAMPQLEEWFHGRLRQVQDLVVCLPHAREFLEFCRTCKIRTFLLSSVHEDHFYVQQASTGLAGYLDKPYVGVWDKRQKIHQILNENGLLPEETLFIGDMEHDIETSRHGGIASCAVLTGYNSLEQLRGARPDLIVEHLGELRSILERQGMRLRPADADPSPERHPIPTVGALVMDGRGHILMIRTHKWSDLWGIPGGKIKSGETAEAALRRELMEETGLEISDIHFVLVQDCIQSPEFYRDAHFVLLNYTCLALGATDVRLNEEAQEFRWVTMDEAYRLKLNTPTRVLLDTVRSRNG
jgi:phosphoglycolate phosphatase-like HAD superfamily hydrolase/ADP-ribose pyrophosphatase YjhB (NUDIX family)